MVSFSLSASGSQRPVQPTLRSASYTTAARCVASLLLALECLQVASGLPLVSYKPAVSSVAPAVTSLSMGPNLISDASSAILEPPVAHAARRVFYSSVSYDQTTEAQFRALSSEWTKWQDGTYPHTVSVLTNSLASIFNPILEYTADPLSVGNAEALSTLYSTISDPLLALPVGAKKLGWGLLFSSLSDMLDRFQSNQPLFALLNPPTSSRLSSSLSSAVATSMTSKMGTSVDVSASNMASASQSAVDVTSGRDTSVGVSASDMASASQSAVGVTSGRDTSVSASQSAVGVTSERDTSVGVSASDMASASQSAVGVTSERDTSVSASQSAVDVTSGRGTSVGVSASNMASASESAVGVTSGRGTSVGVSASDMASASQSGVGVTTNMVTSVGVSASDMASSVLVSSSSLWSSVSDLFSSSWQASHSVMGTNLGVTSGSSVVLSSNATSSRGAMDSVIASSSSRSIMQSSAIGTNLTSFVTSALTLLNRSSSSSSFSTPTTVLGITTAVWSVYCSLLDRMTNQTVGQGALARNLTQSAAIQSLHLRVTQCYPNRVPDHLLRGLNHFFNSLWERTNGCPLGVESTAYHIDTLKSIFDILGFSGMTGQSTDQQNAFWTTIGEAMYDVGVAQRWVSADVFQTWRDLLMGMRSVLKDGCETALSTVLSSSSSSRRSLPTTTSVTTSILTSMLTPMVTSSPSLSASFTSVAAVVAAAEALLAETQPPTEPQLNATVASSSPTNGLILEPYKVALFVLVALVAMTLLGFLVKYLMSSAPSEQAASPPPQPQPPTSVVPDSLTVLISQSPHCQSPQCEPDASFTYAVSSGAASGAAIGAASVAASTRAWA